MSLNDWNKSEIIDRVRVVEGQNGLIQARLNDALLELKRVREESAAQALEISRLKKAAWENNCCSACDNCAWIPVKDELSCGFSCSWCGLKAKLEESEAEVGRLRAQIADDWDQNFVQCGNCSVQIIAKGGTKPNNNGLSDPDGSEDEHLCGRCAGQQMYEYGETLAERDEQISPLQEEIERGKGK